MSIFYLLFHTYTKCVLNLGGGFKYFLFSPLLGEKISNLTNIFQMGWFNHQLVNVKKVQKTTNRWQFVESDVLDRRSNLEHVVDRQRE